MAKFVRHLFLFGLVVAGLASIVNLKIGEVLTGPPHYRLHYKEIFGGRCSYNAIIIGTSHAVHSIRPAMLEIPGFNFFNFALNGSNPEFYYKWYTEVYSENCKKPKLVVYAVDWFMFDETWMFRRFEHDSEYWPFDAFLSKLAKSWSCGVSALVLNRFPVIKHNDIQDIYKAFTSPRHKEFLLKYYDRGYIPYVTNNVESLDNADCGEIPDETISHKQVKYLKKLVEHLIGEGVELIFINIPEYGPASNYNDKKSFGILKRLCKKYDIPYVGYNIDRRTGINVQRIYYSDWGHLNLIGSEPFSRVLSKDLQMIIEKQNM